jgi:hypothetical protein
MTQTTQEQLADLQEAADFDAWADARCAEYEAEEDARHCLGGANDARSTGWVACTDEENAYYAECERLEREAEDRALARAYGSPW